MSFLKKLGQVAGTVGKVAMVAAGYGQLVETLVPGQKDKIHVISQDLAQISVIAQQVEVMGQALGLPGAQKLTAATPLVAQVILQSSILAHHKIDNPVLFQQGCQKIADGMADVLNSLEDKVEVVEKVA
jgi:hypothetical protein